MILFIDDDVVRLKPIADWLESRGFEVKTAVDIDEAFLILEAHGKAIELIILDIMIPYKNIVDEELKKLYAPQRRGGLWFLKEFRKRGFDLNPNLKVIIFTALEKEQFERSVQDFNLSWEQIKYEAYIKKPGSPEVFEQEIRRIFEKGI